MVTAAAAGEPTTLAEVHAALAEIDTDSLPPWRIAVLRNITVETIQPGPG